MNKLKEGEVGVAKAAKAVESASKRHPLQTVFWIGLVVIPTVVVALAPSLHIKEGGWLSLTRIQLGYALISLELAMVVYAYGVGDWSRFEPPELPSSAAPSPPNNPPGVKPAVTLAAAAAPPRAGTPDKAQGGQ